MINEYYQNIGIKDYFKRYGLVNGIKRVVFNKFNFHFVSDYENKKVLWQKVSKKYLKKYLKFKDVNPEGLIFNSKNVLDNPIWVYWNSGFENAPEIVRACYKSLKKYGNREIITLSEKNLDEYIVFPEYIKRKFLNGNISMAAFTDLMRFALLEHYGGTWIDSTVYLTDNISDTILNSDFFALRNSMMLIENPVLYPAWFLHSKKGNNVMKEIRNITFAYWKYEDHIIEYLLPNLIITLVVNINKTEKTIPYMNTDYSEYLCKCLGDNYSKEKLDWILQLTNIHKLSYKFDNLIEKEDTIYFKLVNN